MEVTPMLERTKPHIPNLKARLKTTFTHAADHCNIHYTALDAGGQEGAYLLHAREFQAALGVLDRMVRDDCFLTPKCLQDCRQALVWYRRELQDHGYSLKSREVGELVIDIDEIAENAFA
jgi:hypothetical protein